MIGNIEAPGSITDLATNSVWGPDRLTREVYRRAAFLQGRGVGPGSRVLIAHGGTASFFADLFASWHLGACAACVDTKLRDAELDNLIGFFDPQLVLADEAFSRAVERPLVRPEVEARDGASASWPRAGLDDPALVLFTSGTTGDPKGVVHTFRSLLARASLNREHIGDTALERTLCILPTHFGHGLIGNCLTPLLAGQHLFLWRGFNREGAQRLAHLVDEHRISFFSSVPTHWRMALDAAGGPRKSSLRRVSVGSAPLSADLWRGIIEWAGTDEVVNVYGITETANWIGGASAREHEPEDGLIGRPWGGAVAVRDEQGALHARGEGELVVLTPSVMQCYLQRPDLTSEALEGGWFRTGDRGSIDDAGRMRLTGRLKHEINRSGVKISPEDIDLVLERHPHVAEACAFGVPDEVRGETVAAAVGCAPGAEPSADELRTWCLERVRPHAVPEHWYFVREIPRSDRGKVNRANVRDLCLRGDA